MAPGSYRYYSLDPSGRPRNAEWVDANDDNEALVQVRDRHPGELCEVWNGQRFVGDTRQTQVRAES